MKRLPISDEALARLWQKHHIGRLAIFGRSNIRSDDRTRLRHMIKTVVVGKNVSKEIPAHIGRLGAALGSTGE